MASKINETEKLWAHGCSAFGALFIAVVQTVSAGEQSDSAAPVYICTDLESCKGIATSRETNVKSQWQEPPSEGRDLTEVQRLEVTIATFTPKTQKSRKDVIKQWLSPPQPFFKPSLPIMLRKKEFLNWVVCPVKQTNIFSLKMCLPATQWNSLLDLLFGCNPPV